VDIERFVEMRLSEIIFNDKYRDETELIFFHGTSTKWLDCFTKNGIGIVKLNKKKDFGQGFYLTTRYWQAKDYADRVANATSTAPLIISCVIPVGHLRKSKEQGLIIDQFDEEWLETILKGRFSPNPLANEYDWIYGRCGDGKTPVFEKEYNKGKKIDLKILLPHIIPNKEFPHYEYDQLWLGTKKAISYIKSVEFINREENNHERIPHHN